jgi:hypothetical protein
MVWLAADPCLFDPKSVSDQPDLTAATFTGWYLVAASFHTSRERTTTAVESPTEISVYGRSCARVQQVHAERNWLWPKQSYCGASGPKLRTGESQAHSIHGSQCELRAPVLTVHHSPSLAQHRNPSGPVWLCLFTFIGEQFGHRGILRRGNLGGILGAIATVGAQMRRTA